MDSTAWIAVVSAVIALGAAVVALLQVRVMRTQTHLQEQTRRDAVEPYVWVDYRIDPVSGWLVDMVVRNEGPTVARNVRITADPPIRRAKEKTWDAEYADSPPVPSYVSAMPPGREIRHTLGSHVTVFEQKVLTRHRIKITYDGPFGAVGPLEYELDYADVMHSSLQNTGTLESLTDAIKTVNHTLEQIKRSKSSCP